MKIRCDDLKIKLALLAFILYSILLSSAALAQFDWLTTGYQGNIKSMVNVALGGKVPDEWLSLPNFFYFVVFPFIAAWAVIYGVMEEIQIFRRARTSHKVVSFVMAAMLLPSGWLLVVVNYLYLVDAWLALVAFGVLFFVGIFFWAGGTVMGWQVENRQTSMINSMSRELQNYESQIRKLTDDIRNGRNVTENTGKIAVLEQRIADVRKRMHVIANVSEGGQ
jgi:hypothetical protein